ncbi:MAG: DNA repair protein [Sulfitobacter sp.]|nr:DNA repair protein [Sulfitobacter sp.]
MQWAAMAVFLVAALTLTFATVLALSGLWGWIELPVAYGGQTVVNAGMYFQIGLTVLALSLLFFLPTNLRVLRLENSHRSFQIGMQDVTRAYAAVHAADRKSTFQISSEFDSVRERLAYLRDHPDLSTLEPQVLELAAQMSHISRELATVYSDEKLDRARNFLKQRQQEVEQFNERLDQAKHISNEMKHWLHEVELEESVASAQLERLRAELFEMMPEMGTEKTVPLAPEVAGQIDETDHTTNIDNTVVDMPKAAE